MHSSRRHVALEHQYQMGLESLHETLPEITVDLVFRQQRLQVILLHICFEHMHAQVVFSEL